MASVSGINGLYNIDALNSLLSPNSIGDGEQSDFSNFLADAMSGVQQTDAADKIASMQLLTGEVQDLHTAVLAGEKAELTLRLATTLRNKVVEAYNEIMRMQV